MKVLAIAVKPSLLISVVLNDPPAQWTRKKITYKPTAIVTEASYNYDYIWLESH